MYEAFINKFKMSIEQLNILNCQNNIRLSKHTLQSEEPSHPVSLLFKIFLLPRAVQVIFSAETEHKKFYLRKKPLVEAQKLPFKKWIFQKAVIVKTNFLYLWFH